MIPIHLPNVLHTGDLARSQSSKPAIEAREVLMRRLSTIVCGGALLASSAVVGASPVLATTPPDDDGSAAALAQFEMLGLQYGFTLIDPACSANPSEGTDLTYTCYAMTTLGEPFIASTTLSGTDVVEFDIIAQPGQPLDPSATGTPGAEDSAPFDALGYFDALFSGDAERIATLQASTAPGSPAEAYAVFQIEFVQTLGEAGGEPSDASVFLTGDGVLICVQPDECVHATDLQVVNGQLVGFRVEGEDIAPRLGRATDPVAVGTSTAQLRAAYRSVNRGNLVLYVELTSVDQVMFEMSTAVYVDADGNQTPIDRENSIGAIDFDLKGTATVKLEFPGVGPGGSVRFIIHPADGSAPLAAVIPVDEFARVG